MPKTLRYEDSVRTDDEDGIDEPGACIHMDELAQWMAERKLTLGGRLPRENCPWLSCARCNVTLHTVRIGHTSIV